MKTSANNQKGFTIVELLIVIVVVAVLAAISIVGYSGIQQRAERSVIASNESQAKKKLEVYKATNDAYPPNQSSFDLLINQKPQDKYYIAYTSLPPYSTYTFSTLQSGGGGVADGVAIQLITAANCPTSRVRAVDVRDNRTYWVQKIADGKCWMLTNLAYAGGGTTTYSDTKTLSNGTTDSSSTFTQAKYYIPANANPTNEPANPSTSTDGGVTNPQYGYLYNWCAAMGVQVGTSACSNSSTPLPDTSISICPSGWRLPVGNGAEFTDLNNAINGGLTTTDAGIRSAWLGQWSGAWNEGFTNMGTGGYYRSSTQRSSISAYRLTTANTSVSPANQSDKYSGFAIRCVAI